MECKVNGCSRPVFTRKSGLCQSHYKRSRDGKDFETPLRVQLTPIQKTKILEGRGFEVLESYPGVDKGWLCKCSKGHEVRILFDRLELNDEPCSKCRFPSIVDTHPELVALFDLERNQPLMPFDISKGSEKEIYWLCPAGHSYLALPTSMVRVPRPGCGICAGRQVLVGFNDIESQAPQVAALWDINCNGMMASQAVIGQKKRWFRCANNHEFLVPSYQLKRALANGGTGCKYCNNQDLWSGWNDLATVAPTLASEYELAAHKVPARFISAFTGNKAIWKCGDPTHPEYSSSPQARVRKGNGCGLCARVRTEPGVNDSLSTNPWLRDRWSPSNSTGVEVLKTIAPSDSQWKWLWLCPDWRHDYSASVSAVLKGNGCLVCKGAQVLEGHNDLASSEVGVEYDQESTERHSAELGLPEGFNFSPRHIHKGAHIRIAWKCQKEEEHKWFARLEARTRATQPTGCPYCSGLLVSPGKNDIASQFPELANEWSPRNHSKVSEISFGSHKEVWWVCPIGHRDYQASAHNRCKDPGTGCPDCNTGGFQTSAPAYLYFISHVELDAFKIGIANDNSKPNRLRLWQKFGWEVIDVWHHSDGKVIFEAEQAVLKNFIRKELGLPQALTKGEMGPGSGQKETFARLEHLIMPVRIEVGRVLAKTSSKVD